MNLVLAMRLVYVGILLPVSTFAGQFSTSSGARVDSTAVDFSTLIQRSCEPAGDCDGDGQLQHHTDNGIENDIGVGCESTSNSETTRAHSFLRCFEGDLCNSAQQIVQSVSFGVDAVDVDDVDVTLNFFKGSAGGCDDKASVAGLYAQGPTATLQITVDSGELFQMGAEVSSLGLTLSPAESVLVEISVGDLEGIGKFFLGANTAQQCDDSYIRAPNCAVTIPKPLSEVQSNNIVSYLIRLDVSPDEDGDGVADEDDTCPMTASAAAVDSVGCSDAQADADGDGVCDLDNVEGPSQACDGQDLCLNTEAGEDVDSDGCSDVQDDSPSGGCFGSSFAPIGCAVSFLSCGCF